MPLTGRRRGGDSASHAQATTGRAHKLGRMAPVAATHSRRGLRGLLRCVLFGGSLVAAVIAGPLAMHTLNLHGTPSAHAPAALSVTVADSGEAHQGVAHHSSAGFDGLTSGTAHDPGGSCADCGGGTHLGMAMACVFALLARPPRPGAAAASARMDAHRTPAAPRGALHRPVAVSGAVAAFSASVARDGAVNPAQTSADGSPSLTHAVP